MDNTDEAPESLSRAQRFLIFTGSVGLIGAMATDALAVLGRHTGFAVVGSIEIFQVALVVALSSAILMVSLMNRHATVDLIVGRASGRTKSMLAQIGRVALAITFGLLAFGSIWVAFDLWPTTEMTELLAIRLAPFRMIWITACTLAALHFAVAFVKGLRK
ncbi:TRAP transporter small permease [Sphingomonas soli]|uniref:TRAP transporter small permease n=1 Tax=Sphingomonas soli TaxID=266127 RepID=UPI00082A9D08|nr:TRAP transporter small permease subunit [Sphingomonas soli]